MSSRGRSSLFRKRERRWVRKENRTPPVLPPVCRQAGFIKGRLIARNI